MTGLYPLHTQEDFFLSLISQPPPLPDTAVGAVLILFKKRWCSQVLSVRKSQRIEIKRRETSPSSSSSCSSLSSSSSSAVALTETSVFQGTEADLGVEGRGKEEKSEISERERKGEREKDGEGAMNVRGGVDTPETCEEKESIVEEGQKENALMFWNVVKCVLIDREEEERIVDSSERLTTILNWLKLCMYTPASFSSSSLSNPCVVKREDISSSSSSSSRRASEKEKTCIEEHGEKEEERMKKISTCLQAVRPPPRSFSSLPFLQFGRYVWKRGRKELGRILDRLTSQIDIELLLLHGKKEREEEKNKRGLMQSKNEEDIKTQRKTGKGRIEEGEEEEEEDEEKKNLSHGRGRDILSDDLLEIVIPEQRQKGGEEGEKKKKREGEEKKKKITMKKRDEEELKLALVQAALTDVRDLSRHIIY